MYLYVYIHTHIYKCFYIYTCIYLYVCIYSMYVCFCVCVYTVFLNICEERKEHNRNLAFEVTGLNMEKHASQKI